MKVSHLLTFLYSYVASSKQQSTLRHNISTEKFKLEVCVTKYDSLVSMMDGYEETCIADIMDGDFPWSQLTGTHIMFSCALAYTHANKHIVDPSQRTPGCGRP